MAIELPIIIEAPWKSSAKPQKAQLYTLPKGAAYDYPCIKFKTLLKFTSFPHELVDCHEENFSPSGQLPCLVSKDILAGNEILIHLNVTGHNIDSNLSQLNQANCRAFAALVESTLVFALEYELYATQFDTVTFPIISQYHPFPISYIIPYRTQWRKVRYLNSRKPVLVPDDLYLSCENTMNALSTQLGDKVYLFGNEYTRLT
jgi:Outer mitochondrial membrane transport complex protein